MSDNFVLRPRAVRDLEDIWTYTSINFGQRQAENYISQLREVCQLLSKNQDIGRSCDQIRMGYRKYSVGSHLVFYRKIGDGIEIVRFLHERMDVNQNL